MFVTEILKDLLTDLINKAGSSKRPKLLLRRTESIAEKLLTNWLAYTLYDFLNDVIGSDLFKVNPLHSVLFNSCECSLEKKIPRSELNYLSERTFHSNTVATQNCVLKS